MATHEFDFYGKFVKGVMRDEQQKYYMFYDLLHSIYGNTIEESVQFWTSLKPAFKNHITSQMKTYTSPGIMQGTVPCVWARLMPC